MSSGILEPVWFEGEERYPPPMLLTQRDKKQFYRKGEGWRECEPEDFRVVEGEIVKAQRRINADTAG